MSNSKSELQQLVDVLPQYENQLRYWESQLEAVSNVKTDIYQAQETLRGMLDSEDKMEMLVPVGHNTSIFANVDNLDRILVGIGSRVYMETTRKISLERLDKRLKELDTASKTYNENLVKTQQEYVSLRERADILRSGESNVQSTQRQISKSE